MNRCVRWQPSEILLLIDLVMGRKHCAKQIAGIIGRSVGSVRRKAHHLELTINPNLFPRPLRNPDQSTWSEADKIAEWADVPQELAEIVVETCARHGLEVKAVRGESRTGDLLKCRREIVRRAKAVNYSYPLIGRALNRDHTTVRHAYLAHAAVYSGDRSAFSPYVPSEHDRIAA